APRSCNGDSELVEVTEGFEDEKIRTTLRERGSLLRKGIRGCLLVPLERHAGDEPRRPDRAADVRPTAGHLARHSRPGDVVRAHLADQTVALEAETVGAERVRLDDLRAGVQVVRVNL